MEVIKPYSNSQKGKKEQVAEMFDNIAPKYDFLNHFLSFGIDKVWRRRAIRLLMKRSPSNILDVATGTGDFAIESIKTGAQKVIGVDISEKMLAVGRAKIETLGVGHRIILQKGDSEDLGFSDNSFDAVTVAFGVRNFENISKGIDELFRVLKPGGIVCILEFSKPKYFPAKQMYSFYSFYILPFIGRLFSKDRSAYRYLPESVERFPDGDEFLNVLQKSGFNQTKQYRQTFGVATIYTGLK
ncbi:MAG: bifunctional demethylmenaquinone methyltransferase/2-methoxy-6-polyprenyl-1,4-benzoquinol methylase UbiE [Bacteroidia bacterium]|nr:bifunctional demethylmenaquinone methyltransferase/2-methoxy-6-polyprenyl-1,4-benzoquinol methylase UbiE [Bacteroidia bacterium]